MTRTEVGDFPIELHRCVDNVVYSYEPAGVRNGRPFWRRTDLDVYLQWSEPTGWVICNTAGQVLGRPWDVEVCDQPALPPEGIWVSRKQSKSYVYTLVRVTDASNDRGMPSPSGHRF